jgi:NTP pyrophosphatase (non-canonical NTP hydrolase)
MKETFMKKHDKDTTIQVLKDAARKFRDDRDWGQFHTPKELAIDASVEASELLELFLWKKDKEIAQLLKKDLKFRENVTDELADTLHACLAFATVADIDVASAVIEKIEKTAKKYPVEKARGKATKYTEL